MSAIEVFDPLEGPSGGWSPEHAHERAYLESFARLGSTALIANLRTRVVGLGADGRIFPVTINEAEYGDAYVCLPHTAYALYAKEELKLVNAGALAPALGAIADGAGRLMRAARLNKIVHLDNWMLSTNLHNGWKGEALSGIRALLIERFPDHLIGIRSLNRWTDPHLVDACVRDGWELLPSRQVYVTGDLSRDWLPRRDTRRDEELLSRTKYRFDPLEVLADGDCARIVELYDLLYLDRYSRLNPAFTPSFVELTHRSRILAYQGLRNAEGKLAAVVGCFIRGGVLTTPIVGYDTSRPASEGLYRMASVLYSRMALEKNLRLNGSAGASGFKRNRGARGEIEYSAYFAGHLSWPRRAVVGGMRRLLDGLAVPMMKNSGW